MATPGDTLPEDDLLSQQAGIEQLVNDDARPEPQAEKADTTAPEKDKVETEEKADPRAARMEQLAERRHGEQVQELVEAAAAMVPNPAEPAKAPEAQPAERMFKLKVRGEVVEMPESKVLELAQKNEAADSYLNEARKLLEEAKTVRQPETKPAEPDKVEKIDRIQQAIEKIQLGEDPAEVRALFDTEFTERARAEARAILDEERAHSAASAFDSDIDEGFRSVSTTYPDMVADPIAQNVLGSLVAPAEAEVIARFLKSADENVRNAFAQAGITAEGVVTYRPADAHALFKDMHLKGYPLPRPADLIRSLGEQVAKKFGATPAVQPANQQQQQPLNRTQRKEAIQQPERVTIPRNTTRASSPSPSPSVPPTRGPRCVVTAAVGRAHRSAPKRSKCLKSPGKPNGLYPLQPGLETPPRVPPPEGQVPPVLHHPQGGGRRPPAEGSDLLLERHQRAGPPELPPGRDRAYRLLLMDTIQNSLTVVEMGRAIEHTEKAQLLSFQDWEGIVENGLAYMAGAQFDVEAYLQFKATPLRAAPTGRQLRHLGDRLTNSTPTITNNVALGTGHIKAIGDYMKKRNIPQNMQRDSYVCVTTVDNLRGVKNSLESIHQYTDTGLSFIKFGEIGRYEDFIFVEQTMIPDGGANDSTTFDPYTNTADAWNNALSSWAVFFGDDPVTEAPVVPEEVRAKLPRTTAATRVRPGTTSAASATASPTRPTPARAVGLGGLIG
jgi:hypothetical protein